MKWKKTYMLKTCPWRHQGVECACVKWPRKTLPLRNPPPRWWNWHQPCRQINTTFQAVMKVMKITRQIIEWGPCESSLMRRHCRWLPKSENPLSRWRAKKETSMNGKPCRGRCGVVPGARGRPLGLGLVSSVHPGGVRPLRTGGQVLAGHNTEQGIPSHGKVFSSHEP